MGLREKVALAAVAAITAQIICINCMPRGLPNGLIKRQSKSFTTPKPDKIRELKTSRKLKKNLCNNIVTRNNSNVLNLPHVEDPTDVEGYYRFYCEYPQEMNKLSNTLSQTRNFKREAKQKVPNNIALKCKANTAHDTPPQPYCFRKSNFFPEVEYPLSARDMWIPKYWSRLLDAEVPRDVKIDGPIGQPVQNNTKSTYANYENSPLYEIIKTLKIHNNSDEVMTESSNFGDVLSKKSKKESKHDFDVTRSNFNTTITTVISDTTPSFPTIHGEVTSHTPIAMEVCPACEITKPSSVVPTVTSASVTSKSTDKTELISNNVHGFKDRSSSVPSNKTPKMILDLNNNTYTNNRQVVAKYSEVPQKSDILQFCRNNSTSSLAIKNNNGENWVCNGNDSYITWESVSENPDECFIFVDDKNKAPSQTLCGDNALKVLLKSEPSLIINSKQTGYVTKNSTSVPHTSETTVGIENIKSQDSDNNEIEAPQINQGKGTLKHPVRNRLHALASNEIRIDDSSLLINDVTNITTRGDADKTQSVNNLLQESKIDEKTNSAGDVTPYAQGINSTFEYTNDDETWSSYTEIPYESLAFYSENVNNTWTGNDHNYVIHQQVLPEDSDDTTFLFFSKEKLQDISMI